MDSSWCESPCCRTSLNGSEEVVLWKGPRREIWEQVEVSTFKSRSPLVSDGVRRCIWDFVEYMKLINLSLYLVNMLPIPALDGFQLLAILLELMFGREYERSSIDLRSCKSQRWGHS
ncbi:hypothetical protein EDC04DRAFT_314242 [Pisolithus marmoratus]|nr:hypothetical protein EDC04DRAFT_314242 [Pisolithus marmoratus]